GGVRAPASTTIPEWLGRVVEKLCARDPADRYRNASAVVLDINARGGFPFELETGETRQSYITTSRLCARHAQLERGAAVATQRLKGCGREPPALLVSGLSGMGKSRLMREVRQLTQMQRMVFLEASCYERNPVEFAPIAEVLSQLVPLVETYGG